MTYLNQWQDQKIFTVSYKEYVCILLKPSIWRKIVHLFIILFFIITYIGWKNIDIQNYKKVPKVCIFFMGGGAPWEILVVKSIFWYYLSQLAIQLYIWIFIPPRENLVVGYPVATIFSKVILSVNNRFTKF